jgi:hypothetical protein
MVEDLGPAQCPKCRLRVSFSTDSNGSTIERCECGYKAFVLVRLAAALGVGPAAVPVPA